MSVVVPRLAATVMLLRDGPTGIEVFMTVRHAGMDFMPGALVFPGGGIDQADAAVAGAAETDPEGGAVRVAAVREVFEECGILLARHPGAAEPLAAAEVAPVRARYAADDGDRRQRFGRMVLREGLVLATADLVPFARWVTPPVHPKRFDTHFFLVACPPAQEALHDGGEAVDSLWVTPGAALADHRAGRFDVVLPTEMNLLKLGRSATVAEALDAAGAAPVVTVHPEMTRTPAGLEIRIPMAAGYGVDVLLRRADRNLPPAET